MTPRERSIDRLRTAIVCLVAYLPLLASSPGRVGADTKTYLYLDPVRLLSRAPSLWDADVALGTVTHQTIGYLWPMGPFYAVAEFAGLPDWVAQRLWLGSLLAAAGLGVRYLLRTLDWQGPGLLVAMLAYELSPYLLHYSARISAVLLPWAGLPWMIALTIRSARGGRWRHPALFALVVLTVGSVNATALLLVGLAPVAWLLHAAAVERSLGWRRALATAGRIGVLTVGVSLWWMAGLWAQGAYSLPVTRYTETYEVVADASTAPEVLRGLGYWFFYGNDKFGPWIEPSVDYTQGVWLIVLTFGLATAAVAAFAIVRWRHRSYFGILFVLGTLIAVGAHPYDDPSPTGAAFRAFTRTDAGLALRSTPRALPLAVLATSVFLGAGVAAVWRHRRSWGRILAAVGLVAVVLANPPMWKTRMIERHLDRPEELPAYWLEAARRLDGADDGTRVFEVPGSDFASYRWGNTVDPVTPGLMDRGYVARELVPFGSAESAALLIAFDRRLQDDTLESDSIAPVARLMSVGDLVHRADLTYERFRTARPVPTAALLERTPGIRRLEEYGPREPNVAGPEQPLLDEVFLGIDPDLPDPAPVTRYRVDDPLPEVRLRPVEGSLVLVGDADGIVDAAAAGVLDLDRTLVFAADLVTDDTLAETVVEGPVSIVVTDTNRRRARRWGTIRQVVGYTEQAGEEPLEFDPTDNRLPLFPALASTPGLDPDDARTVTEQRGPVSVRASAYGNPVTYTNDDRPVLAVDGDPTTAWTVAAFAEARGEYLRLDLDRPRLVDTVTLLQPPGPANRHVTEVLIRDGRGRSTRVPLDERSLTAPGQPVPLGVTTDRLTIEITDTDVPRRPTYPGVSAVGFAEVDLGLGPVDEVVRAPRALLDRLGADLDRHDLTVVFTRERTNPREPVRTDPERSLRRTFALPVDRTFEITGTVRVSAAADEPLVDAVLGRLTATDGVGLRARSSARLAGDLPSGASSAFDGDPATAWTGRFGPQAGQWIRIHRDREVTVDDVTLQIVVDSVHSVPTSVRILVDGADLGVFELPLAVTDASRGTTRRVQLPLTATGRTFEFRFETVDERLTTDWYSATPIAMPISVTEIGLGPELTFGAARDIDTGCRDDLVRVDDRPVPVRITGDAAAALDRRPLTLTACAEVGIPAGDPLIDTTAGAVSGFDVDQLVLRSPRPLAPVGPTLAPTVVDRGDTRIVADVPASTLPRWLVLGQSHNPGWRARLADGTDLGPPRLLDGFANAWLLPAGRATRVVLTWTPQDRVRDALWVSALVVLVCLGLVVVGRGEGDGPSPAAPPVSPRLTGPATPRLRPPLRGRTTTRTAALVCSAGLAVGAWAVLPGWPLAVLVVALVGFVSLRRRTAGLLPAVAATGLTAVIGAYVAAAQWRNRYPPDFVWPRQFDRIHVLGVLVVVLIAVEVVREIVTAPRRPNPSPPPG